VGEDEVFDLVVSNPPYVRSGVVAGLAREVREHDPVLALDGGTDGLDAYRALAAGLGGHLAPRGTALFEIGYDQGRSVPPVFAAAVLVPVAVEADLAGLDRMVMVRHIEGEGGAPRDGGAAAF
jgi:release factor glutamine methyltransferase